MSSNVAIATILLCLVSLLVGLVLLLVFHPWWRLPSLVAILVSVVAGIPLAIDGWTGAHGGLSNAYRAAFSASPWAFVLGIGGFIAAVLIRHAIQAKGQQ